jgi:2-methylcitrate dehydratase PrpD
LFRAILRQTDVKVDEFSVPVEAQIGNIFAKEASMNRRNFVGTLAIAGLTRGSEQGLRAQAAPDKDVTHRLAHWIITSKPDDATPAVRREAARTLLNWVACAVGGSHHEALNITLSALAPFSGPAQASVLGRKERLDVMHAALANGMSSHVFDFDDTHLRTIIHPAGPVAAAILALAEYKQVSGRDFLYALTVGIETECRIGNAAIPLITMPVGTSPAPPEYSGRRQRQAVCSDLLNTYKPFPCGIPMHPSIDACIQLRNEHNLTPDQIERIELRVHPLALELNGNKTPQNGAETKYSVYHGAAVAIIYGMAGEKQFSDRAARDPAVIALRDRVTAVVDSSTKEEQAAATVILKDGHRLEKLIENAIGSVKNPMTDAMLEAKFLGLAEGILAPAKARRLIDLCWKVETLSNAADIAKAGAA